MSIGSKSTQKRTTVFAHFIILLRINQQSFYFLPLSEDRNKPPDRQIPLSTEPEIFTIASASNYQNAGTSGNSYNNNNQQFNDLPPPTYAEAIVRYHRPLQNV